MCFDLDDAIRNVEDRMGLAPEAPNSEGTGISWNPKKINDEVDEEGRMCGENDEGKKSKLRWPMFLQIALAAYYFVSFGLLIAKSYTYYVWPIPENDPYYNIVGGDWVIRSDEDSFVCEGFQFYKVCEGPKYKGSTATEECPYDTYDDEDNFLYTVPGQWLLAITIWLLFMLPLLFFCFYNLYEGRYNAVLGLVSYQDEKLEVHTPNTSDVEEVPYARPVKLAFAFTLFCNFAKGAPSSMKSDACGRMVVFGGNLSSSTGMFEAWVAIIYFACFIIILLSNFEYVGHLCWKRCCRSSDSSCLLLAVFNCYHKCMEACCSLWIVVMLCRLVLLVAAVCNFLLRIVRFNWNIDFDWDFPSWAVLSIVSFIDLVVSAIADIYFSKWIPKLAKMIARALRGEPDDGDNVPSKLSQPAASSGGGTEAKEEESYDSEEDTVSNEQGPIVYRDEYVYPNGNREIVETTVFPDGSSKVVQSFTRTE